MLLRRTIASKFWTANSHALMVSDHPSQAWSVRRDRERQHAIDQGNRGEVARPGSWNPETRIAHPVEDFHKFFDPHRVFDRRDKSKVTPEDPLPRESLEGVSRPHAYAVANNSRYFVTAVPVFEWSLGIRLSLRVVKAPRVGARRNHLRYPVVELLGSIYANQRRINNVKHAPWSPENAPYSIQYINVDRAKYWLGRGAGVDTAVFKVLSQAGVVPHQAAFTPSMAAPTAAGDPTSPAYNDFFSAPDSFAELRGDLARRLNLVNAAAVGVRGSLKRRRRVPLSLIAPGAEAPAPSARLPTPAETDDDPLAAARAAIAAAPVPLVPSSLRFGSPNAPLGMDKAVTVGVDLPGDLIGAYARGGVYRDAPDRPLGATDHGEFGLVDSHGTFAATRVARYHAVRGSLAASSV